MIRLRVRFFTLPLVTASLVVTLACDVKVNDKGLSLNLGRATATDEWTRTYDLAAGGRLEIVNGNGLIEASGSDERMVEVRAERRARAGTEEEAAQLLKKVEMREDVSATRVKIEARAGEGVTGFRNSFDVQYHVRVPDGLTVSFKTSNGGIRLQNVDGQIIAVTTNGGITGNGLSGSVEMETVNGGVQADLSAVTGDVKVATTNGGVRLDLPADVKANLDASCVNGGISIDDQFKVDTSGGDSRRRVSAALNGGGPRISAATVNGGIRIRVRGGRQTD